MKMTEQNENNLKGNKRRIPSDIVSDSAIELVSDPELVDHAAIFNNWNGPFHMSVAVRNTIDSGLNSWARFPCPT